MAKLQFIRAAAANPIIRVFLQDSTSTAGAGKTGLTSASAGLNITVMRELNAAAAAKIYTSAGSKIDAVGTIGTYAAPTSTHCKFSEIDATNLPGLYEIQLEQATFGTGDASRFVIGMVTATGVAPCPFEIQLAAFDIQTAIAQTGDAYAVVNDTSFGNAKLVRSTTPANTLTVDASNQALSLVNNYSTGKVPLQPATAGRTLVVDAAGLADANMVKMGPTGSGTAQTARDIGTSVLLSSGTGTGQLDFTSGVVKSNLVQILATALTETAGQIAAAFKKWFNVATPTGTVNSIPDAVAGATSGLAIVGSIMGKSAVTLASTDVTGNLPVVVNDYATGKVPLQPTVALRTLDVSVTGEAGVDWANVGSPATTVGLSGTTVKAVTDAVSVPAVTLANGAHGGASATITLQVPIAATVPDTQKVDVNTIKTQAVVCAAGVTVLASVGAPAAPGTSGGLPTTNGTKLNQTVDLTLGQSIAASSIPAATVGSYAVGQDPATLLLVTPANKLATANGGVVTAGTVSDKTGYTLAVAPPTAGDISTAVWGAATRTLSGFGTLVADMTAAVWAAATRTLSAFGFTVAATVADKTGYSLVTTPPTAAEIADKILGRQLSGGTDGVRTVADALRTLRNKVVITNGVVTVYAEDDTTVAWTGALTTDAGALPITSVDPT